ncbi:Os1348 family NHLP clan protein [Candidatus Leptofilum sp.]|uniref:Os1348 family NHLP clan protein n=1 Tax=Candidatus Leptofilum sp. TaxID=3241576 RepID=UPI003B5BA654
MSTQVMDEVLSRWFRDAQFREQLRNDPEQALANYDLTSEQRHRLFKLKKQSSQSKREPSPLSAVEAADSPPVNPSHPFSLN